MCIVAADFMFQYLCIKLTMLYVATPVESCFAVPLHIRVSQKFQFMLIKAINKREKS